MFIGLNEISMASLCAFPNPALLENTLASFPGTGFSQI